MRFLPRLLHTGAAATILIILWCLWAQHDGLQHRLHEAWQGTAHRIVVFGDDWSDTGKHRVPPTSQAVVRDQHRGAVWTETLCNELACDFIDNFARSIPIPPGRVPTVGALVDSDIFAQAVKSRNNNAVSILPDFKTQVRQFVQYEHGKRGLPRRLRNVDEWTVFSVSFGLWDLFEYAALEQPAAMRAVDSSIDSLFEGLDVVAQHQRQHGRGRMHVVVPRLVDVTFLPRFQARRKDIAHEQSFAEEQHKLVFLASYWNTALSRAALRWENGSLFMPDPNKMIVDQARAQQLHSQHPADASGAGASTQQPLFDHIDRPCLTLTPGRSTAADLNAAPVEKCAHADRHLFWDDLHLSGPAHELIGRAAAALLRANYTVSRAESAANKDTPKLTDAFALKFPPGY